MLDLTVELRKSNLADLLQTAEYYREEVTAAMEAGAWEDAQTWCDQLAIALQLISDRGHGHQ